MGDLSNRLERLTPGQRRLLELRRDRRAVPAPAPERSAGAVAEAARPELVPLTPEQETVWRRYRWTPKTFYNWGLPLRLHGDLHVPSLEAALTALAARHDALRAAIVEEDGRPAQRIADPEPVTLPVADLQHVPEEERDVAARAWVVDYVGQRLDPRGERLWRATLLRVRPDEHVLCMLVDELVCDDRSRIILMRELVELYESLREGRKARLPELTLGYAECIRERRRWLDGPEAVRLAGEWRRSLDGAALLPLEGDRPRVPERTFRGDRLFYDVPPALVRGLHALDDREGVSLYMCLLAAFGALLTIGQPSDLVVTTHVFNRLQRGSEHLVGNFLTHLLVRCRWDGDPAFRDLLRVARDATLATYARKELPVWHVLDGLGWSDFSRRSPVGQFYLVAHDDADPLPEEAGALRPRFEPVYLGRYPGELGLYAYGNRAEDRLKIRIEWDVALFDQATAVRLRDSLDHLLTRAAAYPHRPLSALRDGLDWLPAGANP